MIKPYKLYSLIVTVIVVLLIIIHWTTKENDLLNLRLSALEAQLTTIQLVLMRNPVDNRPYHLIPSKRLKEK